MFFFLRHSLNVFQIFPSPQKSLFLNESFNKWVGFPSQWNIWLEEGFYPAKSFCTLFASLFVSHRNHLFFSKLSIFQEHLNSWNEAHIRINEEIRITRSFLKLEYNYTNCFQGKLHRKRISESITSNQNWISMST